MAATNLYAARKAPCRLAPLILMTDPKRLPDPLIAAQNLPEGAAIIYRHFGEDNRQNLAQQLRQITFARRQQFLVGHDPELAAAVGADGVHFRRGANTALPALWRRRCPDWIITMAGLKNGKAYAGKLSVLDALFVSSVFPSTSPSAGEPIGTKGLRSACKTHDVPVIALGGINSANAAQLVGTGAAGLAGISGI